MNTSTHFMPKAGYCAHRGAFETAPENTLPGILEAVALGAPMIEFDLQLTRDGVPVLMHDAVVDRTTDGSGVLAGYSFEELRRLDAGGWKGEAFRGTRVPTFEEALAIIPRGTWVNCHLKGDAALGATAAKGIVQTGRIAQVFLAAGAEAIRGAREVCADLLICYMDRCNSSERYVAETIESGAQFIQFTKSFPPSRELTDRLRMHGIASNYFYAQEPEEVAALREQGVDFVLVNDLRRFLNAGL